MKGWGGTNWGERRGRISRYLSWIGVVRACPRNRGWRVGMEKLTHSVRYLRPL